MNIPIWTGVSTFAVGQTPFGFYDNDLDFRVYANKVANFCAQRLGYPIADVELQSGSFFTAFEEAVTTYGNELYAYKVRENYLSLEGSSTIIESNNQIIKPNNRTNWQTQSNNNGGRSWGREVIPSTPTSTWQSSPNQSRQIYRGSGSSVLQQTRSSVQSNSQGRNGGGGRQH